MVSVQYPNGLAHAMRRARLDADMLARVAKIPATDIEAWADGRELIPAHVAKTLAACLRVTHADILFGLSFDPRAPDPVIEE